MCFWRTRIVTCSGRPVRPAPPSQHLRRKVLGYASKSRISRSKSAAPAPGTNAVPRHSCSRAPGRSAPLAGVSSSTINSPRRRRVGVCSGARNLPAADAAPPAALPRARYTNRNRRSLPPRALPPPGRLKPKATTAHRPACVSSGQVRVSGSTAVSCLHLSRNRPAIQCTPSHLRMIVSHRATSCRRDTSAQLSFAHPA